MEAWSPITINAVADDTGNLTALFPPNCTPGAGNLVRKQTSGTLVRCEVYTNDAVGGVIELWDINGGEAVNSGTTISNTYKNAEQAAGRAKLLWKQAFKGDSGSRAAILTAAIPIMRGLAARYINNGGATATLSIVADGCYIKTEKY